MFFLPNLFGCRFASKHFQLSRAPTKLHGAERFEERSATNLLPVPRSLRSQRKERNETAWESHRVGISPPKKRGKFGWALFSHPTHPTQLLFFPGFLLLVWWNLAWNLCMNMFIMPVKHEVATTNEALEGYATQNFSRFITRSSFPKN